MSKPSRPLMKALFQSFINSFKSRKTTGNLMGEDYFGNKFFEIPPQPQIGKRRAERWFEPPVKDDFDHEITAEWEAWLRGRRETAPTQQELLKNLAIIKMKEKNAAEIDEKFAKPKEGFSLEKRLAGTESFPKYNEYEVMPGKPKDQKE